MPSSDHDSTGPPRVMPYGDQAFLVELPTTVAVVAYTDAVRAQGLDGVTELVPAARTVLVRYDAAQCSPDALRRRLEAVDAQPGSSIVARHGEHVVTVDVHYDGADLEFVATTCDMTVAEVIRRHQTPTYRSAFCGFAPGFAYLTGLDDRLTVPRLDAPRPHLAAGSVAIAGEFTGVYPNDMPGGWRILGHTDVALWDLDRTPPALLTPGTAVRFRSVEPRAGRGSATSPGR